MDAKTIAKQLVNRYSGVFSLQGYYCVIPNVSWGMFKWGEADLIACTKAGYLIEGEIKISKSDLLNDIKKKKWKDKSEWYTDISQFYYIVPKELETVAREQVLDIPFGVIVFTNEEDALVFQVVKKAKKRKEARSLTSEEMANLTRIGCFKIWK